MKSEGPFHCTDAYPVTCSADMAGGAENHGEAKIFAVAGNPVFHSKSPDMFNAAFSVLSMDGIYTRLAATGTEDILEGMRDVGISGLNVTSPFKEEIVPFLHVIEDAARKTGAVNTIVVKEGRLHGFNTDVEGVRGAFNNNGIKVHGKKALVLGAGGAAKAAAYALLLEGADVTIANGNFEKAEAISEALRCKAIGMGSVDDVLGQTHIIVSCLPVSVKVVSPRLLRKDMVILDANYGIVGALAEDGKRRGCLVVDGREWLLFQGVGAFRIFTGMEPPVGLMRQAAYKQNGSTGRNVALIGFMGAGKSSTARCLGELAGMPIVDIDEKIKEKARMSLCEIFETMGERAFRDMERDEIAAAEKMSGTIISCGGGAPLSRENRDTLKRSSIVVWLSVDADTVFKRVGNDNGRPLLRNLRGKRDLEKMLNERAPLYGKASDIIVAVRGMGPEEIAGKVYDEINKFL